MPGSQKAKASDAVRSEWLRRVEEEYRSAAIAHHLTLWLMQIAASPDLVRAGLRIVEDELTHAELSHRTFAAAGGVGAPGIARETLQLRRQEGGPLELDVTRATVRVFCLGETVAVPLFLRLREGCSVPVARKALDRVLKDEVRHRDFGWTLLPMLFDLPMGATLRSLATRELPIYFGHLRMAYGAAARNLTSIDPADRVWGLMPPAEYADAVDQTLTREWIPRFAAAGIDAQKAWASAPGG
jgi:hypothetical protein